MTIMKMTKLLAGTLAYDRRTLTRTGAGNLDVKLTVPAGSELMPAVCSITNKDTVARAATIEHYDASNNLVRSLAANATLAADAVLTYANVDPLYTLPAGHYLLMRLASVATTEDAIFVSLVRFDETTPTITTVSA